MKKLLLFTLVILTACTGGKPVYHKAENALDAGREFIDACLKGDFNKAAFYMLPDDKNNKHLQAIESKYRVNDKEGRQQLRESSININNIEEVDPQTTIIYYNNSLDKTPLKVKVTNKNGSWLVDLKYTYDPNL